MAAPENSTCPHCKLPLRDYHDFVTCPKCSTSYHEKCWQENSGCPRCDAAAAPAVEDNPDGPIAWYLFHDHKNMGPLTWEQLCSYKGIRPDDLVWNSRLPDWVKAADIPGLLLERRSPERSTAATAETAATASRGPAARGSASTEKSPLPGGGQRKAIDDPTEASPPGSTLAEQILEQLYAEEAAGATPETAHQGDEAAGDGHAGAVRGQARHIIYGTLLTLGGAIIAVSTFLNPLERSTFFYIAAGWALLFGLADLSYGIVGLLKNR